MRQKLRLGRFNQPPLFVDLHISVQDQRIQNGDRIRAVQIQLRYQVGDTEWFIAIGEKLTKCKSRNASNFVFICHVDFHCSPLNGDKCNDRGSLDDGRCYVVTFTEIPIRIEELMLIESQRGGYK